MIPKKSIRNTIKRVVQHGRTKAHYKAGLRSLTKGYIKNYGLRSITPQKLSAVMQASAELISQGWYDIYQAFEEAAQTDDFDNYLNELMLNSNYLNASETLRLLNDAALFPRNSTDVLDVLEGRGVVPIDFLD